MGVFIRTLIICLIICFGYYTWVYLGKTSYQDELSTNKTTVSQKIEVKQPVQKQIQDEKTKIKVCFLSDDNSIRYVQRQIDNPTLEGAILKLLAGPTADEKEKGIYSEIPKDTKLMWVKNESNKIIINLTRNFEYGGGTQSIENRIKQLKLTVDYFNSSKPVYLYLDGKQVEYMGGEGIYIEQPLN